MADFKVEVPINAKGGTSSGASGKSGEGITKELKKLNRNTKKLDKTMYLNVDIIEILSSLAGDLYKLLQPIFKMLSLLFMVIFLPLMPIIKLLILGLAMLVKLFTGGYGNIWELIGKTILGLLLVAAVAIAIWLGAGALLIIGLILAAVALLWDPLVALGTWIVETIMDLFNWIWNYIAEGFSSWGSFVSMIWDLIKLAFIGQITVAVLLWDFIKTLFKGTVSIMGAFWGWFKSLFVGTIDVAGSLLGWFKGLFGGGGRSRGRAGGGNVLGGQSYVVGENGPEMFSPSGSGVITPNGKGGGNTININNPVVRNDMDIKKIASEVSRVLQRQMTGRFSS